MFSTDFIFRRQENLVDNQKCNAEFKPLCKKNTSKIKMTNSSKKGLCLVDFRNISIAVSSLM